MTATTGSPGGSGRPEPHTVETEHDLCDVDVMTVIIRKHVATDTGFMFGTSLDRFVGLQEASKHRSRPEVGTISRSA